METDIEIKSWQSALTVLVSLIVLLSVSVYAFGTQLETYEDDFSMNGTVYESEDVNQTSIRGDFDPELSYGEVPVEVEFIKRLNLQTDRPTLTIVTVEGNMSEVVEPERALRYNQPEELEMPFNGTEPGFYEGELQLKTWRADEGVVSRWLDLRHFYYSLRY